MKAVNTHDNLQFLSGGGELGELIRSKDWRKTPVGNPETWPQSLRTTLGIILNSRFPMFLFWGPELICFYNDAYRPSLGKEGKHPHMLGSRAEDYWQEVWADIEPLIDQVLSTRTATWSEDQLLPIYRNGKVEDVYWTFSYSPVIDESGLPAGVFVTCNETTEKVNGFKSLELSNRRYYDNIMQSPMAMCIFRGSDFVVEIANERMLEIWGKKMEEVLDKPIFQGLPEAKGQGLEQLLEHVFLTGERFEALERPVALPRTSSIETTYLNFVYEALKDPDGTISGIVAIASEVTAQVIDKQNVEEREQRVRALIKHTPFPMAVYVGENMRIELANQSIIDIWGKGNDVIGKSFKEVLPELDNQLVFEQIEKVFKSGASFHTQNTPLDLIVDGKPRTYYFNYSFTPLYDASGHIYGVMNTGADVTDLNIAKAQIEESDKRFRDTVRQAPIGITILRGPQFFVEIANDAYLQLVDRKETEFVGRPLFDSLPEVKETVNILLEDVLNTGTPFHGIEYPIPINRFGKNEISYFDFLYYPLREEDGTISGIIVTVTDVTESVKAKHFITESEKQFRNMVMDSPIPMTIFRGKDLIIQMANKTMFENIWRRKPEDLLGKKALDIFPELKWQKFPDLMNQVFSKGEMIREIESVVFVEGDDGMRKFYLDFEYSPLFEPNGEVSGIMITVNDVTEKVEARQTVENAEERLRLATEAAQLATTDFDLQTKELIYSPRLVDIFGHAANQQFTYAQLSAQMHPEDQEEIVAKAFESALLTGIYEYEARIIKPDDSIRWIRTQGKVFFDQEHKPLKIVSTIKDITEEKYRQQALQESEQKFRSLAETLPQLVWETDEHGKALYASARWNEYSGIMPVGEAEWRAVIHPDDFERNTKAWTHSMATGDIYKCDIRLKNKHGEYRWHTVIGEPVFDKDDKIIKWVGAFTDIHSEKGFMQELEKQVENRTIELENANKTLEEKNDELETMNKELQSFAYISSHDLQEPLRKIQTFSSHLLEKEYENLSEIGKDNFQRMQKAAKRMQTLIEDLLAYSRSNTAERNFEITDLATVVQAVKEDLKEELQQKQAVIEIGEMHDVKIITFQFRQLLYNLISNALKFSKESVTPHIVINSDIKKGAAFTNAKLDPETKYCHISVADNGIGFEPQYRDRIFELFQRLHGRNQYNGTGIGLAIVKKIVENHHGIISASGALNQGATFDIYIPAD